MSTMTMDGVAAASAIEMKQECAKKIHATAVAAGAAAGGSALLSIPILPLVVIPTLMSLELKLTIDIAHVFGESIGESAARGAMGAVGCTVVGYGAALGLTSLFPIPGVTVAINAGVAATVAEKFGWKIYKHYAEKNGLYVP